VNASWENDPNLMQWRRQFRFVVGVFDLPSMTTEHRLSHGEGPFCNARLQNEVVGGILRILRDFPDVGVLFKSKREFRDLAYDLVPNLEQVLNLENPRLKILGQRDNPVSAVAACDFVIAVPFTSPVMLALSMGKSAAYYDPIHLCNFSFDQTFDAFMIKNEEDLVSKIKSLMNLQPPIEFDCDYFDSLRERVRREFGKSNPSQKINLENSLIPG
jgi:polysaccharide biosynthesis PFTS motif protein